GTRCGRLGFEELAGKWKWPVTLPQFRTEAILEEELLLRPDIHFLRGWSVLDWTEEADGLTVTCKNDGETQNIRCRWLVGCDGKRSIVRQKLGIEWKGGAYPDRYRLGDFPDTTDFGTDAVIHLHGDGLVESFPL